MAATKFKQRTRKMLEYYPADRLNYAVCGTPNRLEYDQGFFVKLGDGAADLKPIAHLYKTQVYELARYLGIPKEICDLEKKRIFPTRSGINREKSFSARAYSPAEMSPRLVRMWKETGSPRPTQASQNGS